MEIKRILSTKRVKTLPKFEGKTNKRYYSSRKGTNTVYIRCFTLDVSFSPYKNHLRYITFYRSGN